MQYSREELEAHLAIAILELVRIRRRSNDAKVIDGAERDLMATKIDKAFETSNRFHVVERQKTHGNNVPSLPGHCYFIQVSTFERGIPSPSF